MFSALFCFFISAIYFTLNSSKTYHISITKPRTAPILTYYYIGATRIKNVNEMRDLGVIFDSYLSFKPHVMDTIKRVTSLSGALSRFIKEINKPEIAQRLNDVMIRPIAEYAFTVWAGKYVTLEKQLEKPTHTSSRQTLRLPYYHLAQGYLPFEERIRRLGRLGFHNRLMLASIFNCKLGSWTVQVQHWPIQARLSVWRQRIKFACSCETETCDFFRKNIRCQICPIGEYLLVTIQTSRVHSTVH